MHVMYGSRALQQFSAMGGSYLVRTRTKIDLIRSEPERDGLQTDGSTRCDLDT